MPWRIFCQFLSDMQFEKAYVLISRFPSSLNEAWIFENVTIEKIFASKWNQVPIMVNIIITIQFDELMSFKSKKACKTCKFQKFHLSCWWKFGFLYSHSALKLFVGMERLRCSSKRVQDLWLWFVIQMVSSIRSKSQTGRTVSISFIPRRWKQYHNSNMVTTREGKIRWKRSCSASSSASLNT